MHWTVEISKIAGGRIVKRDYFSLVAKPRIAVNNISNAGCGATRSSVKRCYDVQYTQLKLRKGCSDIGWSNRYSCRNSRTTAVPKMITDVYRYGYRSYAENRVAASLNVRTLTLSTLTRHSELGAIIR